MCPVCHGLGQIDEREERDADMRSAGIVVDDATDEDFRSSPMLWHP
jgi:hypothetical protein